MGAQPKTLSEITNRHVRSPDVTLFGTLAWFRHSSVLRAKFGSRTFAPFMFRRASSFTPDRDEAPSEDRFIENAFP